MSGLVLTGPRSQSDTERHSATLFRVTNPTLILLPDIGMFECAAAVTKALNALRTRGPFCCALNLGGLSPRGAPSVFNI